MLRRAFPRAARGLPGVRRHFLSNQSTLPYGTREFLGRQPMVPRTDGERKTAVRLSAYNTEGWWPAHFASPPATPAADGKSAARGFRCLWQQYGMVGVVTYLGVYVLTLGGMYLAVSAGVVKTGDVTWIIEKLHLEKFFEGQRYTISPKAGDFVVAWVATKLTEPVRFMITLAITPPISRFLRPALYAKNAVKAAKVSSKV